MISFSAYLQCTAAVKVDNGNRWGMQSAATCQVVG